MPQPLSVIMAEKGSFITSDTGKEKSNGPCEESAVNMSDWLTGCPLCITSSIPSSPAQQTSWNASLDQSEWINVEVQLMILNILIYFVNFCVFALIMFTILNSKIMRQMSFEAIHQLLPGQKAVSGLVTRLKLVSPQLNVFQEEHDKKKCCGALMCPVAQKGLLCAKTHSKTLPSLVFKGKIVPYCSPCGGLLVGPKNVIEQLTNGLNNLGSLGIKSLRLLTSGTPL